MLGAQDDAAPVPVGPRSGLPSVLYVDSDRALAGPTLHRSTGPGTPALASKSLLVIVPTLFGYETRICAEMTRQGAQVDMLLDRHFDSTILKAVTRIEPRSTRPVSDLYFLGQIERLSRRNYDCIVVIQGESVSANTVSRLRASFPRARIVYYTWDSLSNKPHAWRNLALYDRCSSFDPVDASRFGMRFRPLFFCKEFEQRRAERLHHDISFVGTIHGDRYDFIRRLRATLPSRTRLQLHMYIQARWVYWARRALTRSVAGSSRAEFSFEAMDFAALQATMLSSAAVLDIESPRQHGLTMRTLEALGSRTKLLTTNPRVRDYDFFDARNICVLDRHAPRLDPEFLETPYYPCATDIYRTYRLSEWVCGICND